MSYRNYANTNGFIVAQNGTADYTSIADAITAINAKGLTAYKLYLTDPLYTENVTFPAGGLISTLSGSQIQQNIRILGTVSFSGNGLVTLSNLTISTNGAAAVNIDGLNTINVILKDCTINSINFTGLLVNNPNAILSAVNTGFVAFTNSFAVINVISISSSGFTYCSFGFGSNVPNNFAAGVNQF
jgi:hypothetical protein